MIAYRHVWLATLLTLLICSQSLAQPQDECGGYSTQQLIGWLYDAASGFVNESDDQSLCRIGSEIDSRVQNGQWTRRYGDDLWQNIVLRYGVCNGPEIGGWATSYFDRLPGQTTFVAGDYCRNTWEFRDESFDTAAIQELTTEFRQETLCEVMMNSYDPPGRSPLPTDHMDALGEALCAELRSGSVTVDGAFSRWARETISVGEELGSFSSFARYALRAGAWALSGIAQFIVALLAVVATILTIAVGIRKLSQ